MPPSKSRHHIVGLKKCIAQDKEFKRVKMFKDLEEYMNTLLDKVCENTKMG